MKKKSILFLLVLLPLMASAATEIDGIYYILDSVTNKATVECGTTKYSGNVIIPKTVNYNGVTYRVTEIGSCAFMKCSDLTSVTIPNSVTLIGNDAFYKCSGLTSVIIPYSVTKIRWDAFRDCSSLTSIEIPNSVTTIEGGAFRDCSSLISVNIPNSVTSIESCIFLGCTRLISISVNSGNMVYDSRDNCHAIIETATNTLIAGCKNTVIPNSVTSIGESAFIFCSSMTSIEIPNSVKSIGDYAFRGCSGLTSIEIPNSVQTIRESTFDSCSGLTEVTIPNSVRSIIQYAFRDCSGLTSITIPSSVTSIALSAFEGCSRLTDVYCYAEKVPSTQVNAFYKSPISSAVLHVPATSVDAYKAARPWSGFGTIQAMATDEVPATSIALDFNSLSKTIGETCQLKATILPAEALQDVTWSSTNPTVATVNENGLVTAIAAGTATIKATTTDGTNLTASCVVTVSEEESIYIETDVTSQFPTDWQGWTGATGYASWAAPQVTTNDGRTVYVCEKYNNSSAELGTVFKRTLSGLTNGTYRIELYGAAASTKGRDTGISSDMTSSDEGDETAVYLYAKTASDTVKQYIPVHWATSFSSVATAVLNGVDVTDGTVEIGLYSDKKYTNWHVVQIKGVTALVDVKELYVNALERAQSALSDASYANVTGTERTALQQAIRDNSTVSAGTAEAYQTATNALETAIKSFTNAGEYYDAFITAKNMVAGYNFPYATAEKKSAAETASTAVPTSAAQAGTLTESLLQMYRLCAESSALMEGVEGSENVTDTYIQNPKAEDGSTGWQVVWGEGSVGAITVKTAQPWTDGSGNSNHHYFDGGYWGAQSWDATQQQEVTLPAGHYQLTVLGRSSEDVKQTLFAGDNTVDMPHIGSIGGLFNLGWEQTSMEFELANTTTMYIGVRGITNARQNWMSFSDFRLVRFPEIKKCATPTISYKDGKLEFNCETEGVEYVYHMDPVAAIDGNGSEVSLPKTMVIVYATKEGYDNSDVVRKEISVGGTSGLRGDLNGDGTVGMPDAMFIVNKMLKGKYPDEE